MNFSYKEQVINLSDNFIRIKIDDMYAHKISQFVQNLIGFKSSEQHHIIDNNREYKRFYTGFLGEAALEKYLGISIIDWSIGNSKNYHTPDIPGYRVGIKTVEYGKFPIIFKHNTYAQIICIRSTQQKNLIYICGLATPSVLNMYQSDALILDTNLRNRGTKTGFYGFNQLKYSIELSDLDQYKK